MAFLDNSGDIILDAVLTDVGRKRMAQGNFKITKFAIGDDEIDYGLYNKNHPSGSAYYDLEIMQTPIFEAFTKTNANINDGLLANASSELLYLPVVVANEKLSPSVNLTSSVYYLAVNSETGDKLKTAFGDSKYYLQSGLTSEKMLILESGLDTTDLKGDASNRSSYLVNQNLIDNKFNVYADNRFIGGVLGAKSNGTFRNTSGGGEEINMGPLTSVRASSATADLDNYTTFTATGITDDITYEAGATVTDTSLSTLAGPRGTATALNFSVDNELSSVSAGTQSTKYSLYGKTGQTIFGGSDTYDYIDTTVIVEGNTSTSRVQVPVRIIRFAG